MENEDVTKPTSHGRLGSLSEYRDHLLKSSLEQTDADPHTNFAAYDRYSLNTVGKNIRIGLDYSGKSQASLARYMGVSKQLVTQWVHKEEKKILTPSRAQIERIAVFLLTTAQWLRTAHEDPEAALNKKDAPKSGNAPESKIGEEIISYWLELFPEDVPNFDVTIRLNIGELHFDYVSPIAVSTYLGARYEADVIRQELWKLNLVAQNDREMRTPREYYIVLYGDPDDPRLLRWHGEADVCNLRVVIAKNGIEVVNMWLDGERSTKKKKGPIAPIPTADLITL